MNGEVQSSGEALAQRSDFPALHRTHNGSPLIYFDGPAGVQVPQQVIDRISWYYSTCNANAHGQFITSRETDRVVDEARCLAADYLGAPGPESISFGANMTTLTFSLSRAVGRSLREGDEVVITQLDHEANRGPWLDLREKGAVLREVRMRLDGRLDYEDLAEKINDRTRIVALGFASNALGTVNDIALVRRLSKAVGAWLVVDAVHYAPHFLIDFNDLDLDFLLCSAYKFYGPHVGILCCRSGLLQQLEPERLRTQDQRAPYRMETGTLNHAALAGVSAAIEYLASLGEGATVRARIASSMQRVQAHERDLARAFFHGLKKISGVTVHGPPFDATERAPTVSFTVAGLQSSEVARRLGEQGLLVWDGDFYAARAVEVLGLAEKGGLVRVGMAVYLCRRDVDRLLEAVADIVSEAASIS